MELAYSQAPRTKLSAPWFVVVVLSVVAVVKPEAAGEESAAKAKDSASPKSLLLGRSRQDDKKKNEAPPEEFDWEKFYEEKEERQEADPAHKKFDWDDYFQTLKNQTKDPTKKFEWDKLIEALNNQSGSWGDENGTLSDLYNDLLLDDSDESLYGNLKCNKGYSAYRGSCYMISNQTATFTKCQEICEAEGGSLATVTDDRHDQFLWNLVRFFGGTAQYGTWIGLFVDINSQGGDWEWVDGSAVRYTNDRQAYAKFGERVEELESNLGCAKVSCATMIPTCYWCEDDPTLPRLRGWDQIRCIREQHCLCEQGVAPSVSYLKSVDNLNWPGFLHSVQPIYFGLGYPCAFFLIWALVGTLMVTRRPNDHPRHDKYQNVTASNDAGVMYGNLLTGREDNQGLVHEWILRGGYAAVSYAVALLVLAFTVSAQNQGMMLRIFINALESLFMSGCKFVVGLSAFYVHLHLSPTSRAMAGPWVLILSVSKMAMAVGQLLMAIGYLRVALSSATCEALSLFTWSCLIGVVFQSMAGFSLFRVYYRTVRRVGDREVFSRVVGCWWSALVASTFLVGVGLWWCGAMMLIDADSGLAGMPIILGITACCQLVAGMSMLAANGKIQDFFDSPEGKTKYAELAVRIGAESSTNGELRSRTARSRGDIHC